MPSALCHLLSPVPCPPQGGKIHYTGRVINSQGLYYNDIILISLFF